MEFRPKRFAKENQHILRELTSNRGTPKVTEGLRLLGTIQTTVLFSHPLRIHIIFTIKSRYSDILPLPKRVRYHNTVTVLWRCIHISKIILKEILLFLFIMYHTLKNCKVMQLCTAWLKCSLIVLFCFQRFFFTRRNILNVKTCILFKWSKTNGILFSEYFY